MFPEESSLSVQIVVPLLKVIGISTFNVKIFFGKIPKLGVISDTTKKLLPNYL